MNTRRSTDCFGATAVVKRIAGGNGPEFSIHPEGSLEFQMVKASVRGFDAWMSDRTNAAHAAYMAQHSAGGQAY